MHRETRHIASVTLALMVAVLLVSLSSSVFAQRVVDKDGRVYYLGAKHAEPGQIDPARILSPGQMARAAAYGVGLSADNKTGLPPVGNQSVGNCTCWATGYNMKTYQEGQEHGWGPAQLANYDNIVSPKFLYNQVNGGGDTGAWSYMVMDLIADKGACSWTDMPEDSDWWTFPNRPQFEAAQPYRGNGGAQFFFWGMGNAGDLELAAMKAYLDAGNVFVIEVPVYYDSFVNVTGPEYLIDEPAVGDVLYGYHAICVSGYDDDKQDNGANTVGGFEFVNSWSTCWGDSGFAWFSYEFVRNYADCAGFIDHRNGYVPSHAGWVEIDHTDRSDLTVTGGVTPTATPAWDTLVFYGDQWFGEGQPNYYGMADLTDAAAYLPPAVDCGEWFVGASDKDRHNTGTLNSLEVFQVGGGGSWVTTGTPEAIPDETGVPVYLTVFAGVGPDIDVSQTTLDLGTLTGPATDDTTIQVENLGGYGCDWTLSESVPWLTVTPSSGTLGAYGTQQLTIAVDPTGLAAGAPYHYSGIFTVERAGVPADTVDVTVEFDYPPDLAVNTNTVSLGSITHTTNDISVYVYNTGGDTMDWTLTEGVSWLSVAPASGTGLDAGAQDWLTVTVDPAGLTDGAHYSDTLEVSRDGAAPADTETVTVDFPYHATLAVPSSYPTIQEAIDRSLDGDIIYVAAGTYNENINFNGKNVVVQGVAGASATTIDGGGTDSVVTFNSGEGNAAVLHGFTVQNGSAQRGGGVYIDGASPTVSNSIVTGNTAVSDGGGIYATDGAPVLYGNELTANSAVSGGGICLVEADAIVDYQNIHGNNAELGGGFCGASSSFTMSNSEVRDNTASAKGGGLYMVFASTPTMEGNLVAGNTATTYGGGIYCGTACTLALRSTTVAGNGASSGGGIYLENTSPTINSTIVAFSTLGAGVYCAAAAPTITYCNGYENMLDATTAANYVGIADPTGSNGNLSADPLFHDAASGDYHLESRAGRWGPASTTWVADGASSPSIDGGDPALAFAVEPTPNGERRNQGGYGNTVEASKTPCEMTITDGPSGDVNPVVSTGDVACSVTLTVTPGHTVTYAWEAVDGEGDPAGSFDDDTAASPVWTAPANLTELNANYTISVTVTCDDGGSVMGSYVQQVSPVDDVVTLSAGPAGDPNPVASEGDVACSVTAEDSRGHALTYLWQATDGAGDPAGTFDDVTAQNPTWTAPRNAGTDPVDYTIGVTATCSQGEEATGSFTQTVNAELHVLEITAGPSGDPNPVASAGQVQCSVTADDTKGHALSYAWTAEDGGGTPAGSFNNNTAQNPIWTAPQNLTDAAVPYTISVTVTCSEGLDASGSYVQTVEYDGHTLTIDAGYPQGAPEPCGYGEPVRCSVNATDSEGHGLSYLWEATDAGGAPAGSFDDDTAQNPVWTAPLIVTDEVREYTLQVTVTCSAGLPAVGTFQQHVTPESRPAMPTDLAAVLNEGADAVVLTWTDASDNEEGFAVRRRMLHADGTWDAADWETIMGLSANTTTYTDSTVVAPNAYQYSIRSYNSAGPSNWTASVRMSLATSVPNAPTSLDATAQVVVPPGQVAAAQGGGVWAVELTWQDNSDDELGFTLQRRERQADGSWPEAGWATVAVVAASETSFTDDTVEASKEYQYRIRAFNDVGTSNWAAPARTATVGVPPDAPTSLTATVAGGSEIELAWNDNADNEAGYVVQRRYPRADGTWSADDWATKAWPAPNATGYVDTSPIVGRVYQYRVRAYNAAGSSNWAVSEKVAITVNPPDKPTNLSAQVDGDNNVLLTWTDASNDEMGFAVQRRMQNADGTWPAAWTTLQKVGPNVRTYTDDSEFPSEGDYQYHVRAYNDVGSSAWSSNARVTRLATVPAAPTDLAAAQGAAEGIYLSWADAATNERCYKVQRRMQNTSGAWPTAWNTLAELPADTEAYTDATVLSGNAYQYRARAENYLGPSNWSPTVIISAQGVAATHVFAAKANPYMIGLPAGAEVDAAAIAYWDADAGRLVAVDGAGSEAGRGYWAQFARNATVSASAANGTVVYTGLKRGWNLIASPYTTAIGFDGMSGPVLPIAWTDQGDGYELAASGEGLAGVSAKLQPWQSYWVYATADGDLTFRNSVESSGVVDVAGNGAGWQIQIVATTGSDVDAANWCGVGSGPAAEAFSIPNPPQGNSAVDVYFGQENPMAAEVQAPADTVRFDFVVSCSADSPVTVQFPDLSSVPGGCALVLYDVEAGKSVNLWTSSAYTYSGKGVRHFRIEASRGNGNTLTIGSVSTQQTGAGVALSYSLSTAAEVTVEVRNISGRMIRQIPCGIASAGLNTATWNLRSGSGSLVPSGTYLCTITARADDGTQTSAVRTMSIRR